MLIVEWQMFGFRIVDFGFRNIEIVTWNLNRVYFSCKFIRCIFALLNCCKSQRVNPRSAIRIPQSQIVNRISYASSPLALI
jgi:hypothetical protein